MKWFSRKGKARHDDEFLSESFVIKPKKSARREWTERVGRGQEEEVRTERYSGGFLVEVGELRSF